MLRILIVENVSKKFGNQRVLDQVSFEQNQGEILGLVGPNGAGKTTLMRIITGLIKNYDGVVTVDREDIKRKTSFHRKKIGAVIESPGFYPYMTGYQNLDFFSRFWGDADPREIEGIAELLGLSKAIHKKVKYYSMGMKQRLGIAQALLKSPDVLVLDEPTNGLDPNGIHEIREYLKRIAEEKKMAMFISSHLLSEIERVCDRVMIIQHGKIIQTVQLHQCSDENSELEYVFETSEGVKLSGFLKKINVNIKNVSPTIVVIRARKNEMPGVIQKIAKQEILFTSVTENKKSLEKHFLELMEDNQIG